MLKYAKAMTIKLCVSFAISNNTYLRISNSLKLIRTGVQSQEAYAHDMRNPGNNQLTMLAL